MTKNLAIVWAANLLFCATPAAAQFDAEGMELMNQLNSCIQTYAFEKDDGIKSPETIADQSLVKCEDKSLAFEAYLVRHSVNMTDKVRSSLQNVRLDMAREFVLLNRRAGRIHAPNQ